MHADHRPTAHAGSRVRSGGTSSRRRAAALAGLGLVATAFPVLGVAGPAAAAVECTTEASGELPVIGPVLEPACDDQHPPETTFESIAPQPNAGGWLRQNDVTLRFSGAYQAIDDTDTDPIVFECKLDGPAKSHDWRSCTSPVVYEDLAETGRDTQYTFQVRAVDEADAAITVTPGLVGGELETVDDRDATPASTAWRIDTVAPRTFILGGPTDPLSPEQPVVWARQTSINARSNEAGATLTCAVDGAPRPCAPGKIVLRELTTGVHTVTVSSTDPAGNSSPEVSTSFEVGTDLAGDGIRRSGWAVVASAGDMDDNLVQARRIGALLQLPDQGTIRELRLYVPTEVRGVVRVKIGNSPWRRVDLGGREEGQEQVLVRRRFEQARSGPILIEAMSRKVRLDGLYAR